MEEINIQKKDDKIFYIKEDIKKDIIQQNIENELYNTKKDENIIGLYESLKVNIKKKFPQKINIIYRDSNSKMNNQYLQSNTSLNNNPFILSNDICEYNARQKLSKFTKNTEIKPFNSTNWNYDIDINHFINKKNEEFEKLLNNVCKKEKEIIQTEKLFLKNSIPFL